MSLVRPSIVTGIIWETVGQLLQRHEPPVAALRGDLGQRPIARFQELVHLPE